MSQLVKMVREEPVHPGGPTEAMVPREEVENWWRHGWQVAKEPEAEAKPHKSRKKDAATDSD